MRLVCWRVARVVNGGVSRITIDELGVAVVFVDVAAPRPFSVSKGVFGVVEVVVGAAALPFPVQTPARLFFIPFVSSILGPILDGQEG